MSRPVVSPRQAGVSIVPGLWSDPRMLGSSLADVFRTPDYDCRVVDANHRPEFAVTRLRSGPREMERAPAYPPDKAVLICVSLTPAAIGQWRRAFPKKHDWVPNPNTSPPRFPNAKIPLKNSVDATFLSSHYLLSPSL